MTKETAIKIIKYIQNELDKENLTAEEVYAIALTIIYSICDVFDNPNKLREFLQALKKRIDDIGDEFEQSRNN